MLTREENDLVCRTARGTPMGDLMRRYWIPVLTSSELPKPDCPPRRVKLLGEKLVAFRDSTGKPGLVDERCPHRGASLFFGRNEEAGLRCVYHGWKFDRDGRCVDMPSEPADSTFKNKVRLIAYPCIERGGVIWAYMGPEGTQPHFPHLEWLLVPDSHRHTTRHLQECNWFQAFEGGFDNSHVRFLHRGTSERPVPPGRHVGFEAVPADFGFIAARARRTRRTSSGPLR
jgi:phthalate 4,5-dioxygenase